MASLSGGGSWIPGSPAVLSGAIASGQIGTFHTASGVVVSGVGGSYGVVVSPSAINCKKCKKTVSFGQVVWMDGYYCFICSNFDFYNKTFTNRLDWILEGLEQVFAKDTPLYVIADYLEEHSRQADADYIRNLMKEGY